MVDISGFRQADNRVNQDVSMVGASSADGQLPVSTMHGVSGLEGNNSRPSELIEV